MIKNKLDLPHKLEEDKLNKILSAHLQLRGRAQMQSSEPPLHFWEAEFFHLHRSKLFNAASESQKQEILIGCGRNLLNEAYFVEKSGFAYSAKMILSATSTEMAQVYSQIGSDEATHLAWIAPYVVAADRTCPQGFFLNFLSTLIEECSSHLLTYLVQIILEGWGLQHYRELSEGCIYQPLKKVFLDIVKDEALHHYTGEVLFDYASTTKQERQFIQDCLFTYAEMVRVGPLGVIKVCDEVLGGLSKAEKKQLSIDILGRKTAQKKLHLLRKLMLQPGLEGTIQLLEDKGMFLPE